MKKLALNRDLAIAPLIILAAAVAGASSQAAEPENNTQNNRNGTPSTVGTAPAVEEKPQVTRQDVFAERSALTKPGSLVIEPSFTYAHTDSNRVAIEAFTVLPSLAIGNIEVSEVNGNTYIGSLNFRYGVTPRFELEARFPYQHRTNEERTRPLLEGAGFDEFNESDGSGLGDIELAARYQLTTGLGRLPILLGNLRVKSDTGDGPFDVDRETVSNNNNTPEDPSDDTVLGQRLIEQPTGSGFWSVSPGLTVIIPSDPAVFFSNLSYTFNLEQDTDDFGKIDPGDQFGANFGIGLALNARTSMSFGYNHTIIFGTDGFDEGNSNQFDQLHVGAFSMGVSYRLTPKLNVNGSVGIGVTEESPDVTIGLRFPYRWALFGNGESE